MIIAPPSLHGNLPDASFSVELAQKHSEIPVQVGPSGTPETPNAVQLSALMPGCHGEDALVYRESISTVFTDIDLPYDPSESSTFSIPSMLLGRSRSGKPKEHTWEGMKNQPHRRMTLLGMGAQRIGMNRLFTVNLYREHEIDATTDGKTLSEWAYMRFDNAVRPVYRKHGRDMTAFVCIELHARVRRAYEKPTYDLHGALLIPPDAPDDLIEEIMLALKRAFRIEGKSKQFHHRAPDDSKGGVAQWVGHYCGKWITHLEFNDERKFRHPYKDSLPLRRAAKEILGELIRERGPDGTLVYLDRIADDRRNEARQEAIRHKGQRRLVWWRA